MFWRWLSYIQWENPITNHPTGSYTLWLTFFYILASMLCLSMALCAFVARCGRATARPPLPLSRRAERLTPPAPCFSPQLLPLRRLPCGLAGEAPPLHRVGHLLGATFYNRRAPFSYFSPRHALRETHALPPQVLFVASLDVFLVGVACVPHPVTHKAREGPPACAATSPSEGA